MMEMAKKMMQPATETTEAQVPRATKGMEVAAQMMATIIGTPQYQVTRGT